MLDGVVVYLNGEEVFRHNSGGLRLPTPDELGDATVTHVFELPPELLLPGDTQLAAAGTQAEDYGATFFEMLVESTTGEPLLPEDAVWFYTVEPPQSPWRDASFDHSIWQSGPAPLGWRRDDLGTKMTTREAGPPAAWMRTEFEVVDPGAVEHLLLEAQRADGMSVWLNGVEIWRAGLPTGEMFARQFAPMAVEPLWLRRNASTLVDPSLLVSGTNLLAVQAHASSSFATMRVDAKLYALP